MMPVKESRSMWGLVWLEQVAQDVRYACRMLAANPGFASIAVLSLAIGIGANSAIFSFADALLLRPLPVARPGEVLTIGSTVRINGSEFTVIGVTPPGFSGLDQYVRSDFFVPLMMSPRLISDPKAGSLEARDARNLNVKGRLKPGVSQAEAQTELTTIAA